MTVAKSAERRYGLRDATTILICFRHGLHVSELCTLTWDQFDFGHRLMHLRRVKKGMPSVHEVSGTEVRALKREDDAGRFMCMTERGALMTSAGFRKGIARRGDTIGYQPKGDPRNYTAISIT